MKRLVAVVVSIVWLVLLVGGGYLVFTGGVERVLSLLPQDLRDRLGAPVAGIPEEPTSPEEPAGPTEPQPPPSPEAPATATPTPTSTPPSTAPEPTPAATATPTLAASFVPVAVVELTQLRAGPGPDYSIVGTVDAGSTVALVAQDPSGAWYQLLDGSWIQADALAEQPPLPVATPTAAPSTPPPEETPAPAATPVVARVNADANLRAGPGTEYERVGGVRFNEEVRVVGKTPDGQWYLLDTGAWLFSALIDEPLDVPVVRPEAQPTPAETPSEATPAPVTNTVANLRAGPGTEFEVVETVPAGTPVTVVGRNPAGDWLRLEDGSWIFANLVDNVPEDLPVVEPGEPVEAATPTPEATATVEATPTPEEEVAPTPAETPVTRVESNLRSGPGLDFPVVRVVPAGTPLTLVGRNEEGDWLRLEDGTWIAFILVDNVPENLPVMVPEEATATPESTATPEDPEPEATPTEEPTPASEGAAKVGGETPAQPVVNRNANLRSGPGTEFEVVRTVPAGTPVTVVGRNPAGDWLQLEDGSWIFAALVDNVPEELPVVEP